jgi:hypothetical protein
MSYPPRLSHLATRAVLVARLRPVFAEAHNLSDEEADQRLAAALSGSLLQEVLSYTWDELKNMRARLSEAEVLDRVAKSLAPRPLRPGRKAEVTRSWSAFFVLADIEAGIASEAARRALQSEEGQRMALEGLREAGRYLAAELLRGK